MHPIFGDSRIPRYVQLADVLRQRINRGVWKPGERLPSLNELVEEFDVARVTVRQSIDVLTGEGLVSPQQGRGTFVSEPKAGQRKLHAVTTVGELAELYRGTKPQMLNLVESTAAPGLTEKDGIAAPKYFFMRRVHSIDDAPYSVISIYLDDRIFRLAPERFRSEFVIPLLLAFPGVHIAEARQTVTIGSADVDIVGHLGIALNSPVANIRRVFKDADGTVIYLAEATQRGDFFHLDMDMKP